jgi:nucleoside-diphosphate-sugar epimerase
VTAASYPDVLVWGACGFIGRHLVSDLVQRGTRVSVLTRGRRGYPPRWWSDRVQWFELTGSSADAGIMQAAVEQARVIFNFAGSTGTTDSNRDPLGSLDANNRPQLQLLEACRAAGVHPHVVFTSSRLVYGRPLSDRVDEQHPINPASMYAAHKACCEHYHRIYASRGVLTATVLRISNAFGADPEAGPRHHGMINAFVQAARAGRPIELFGEGRQLRDFIYIADLVDVLLTCGRHPSAVNETFNIGAGVGTSLREAAEQVVAQIGGPPVRIAPWPPEYSVVETGDYVTDVTKARNLIGLDLKWSFERGLTDMIEEYGRHIP